MRPALHAASSLASLRWALCRNAQEPCSQFPTQVSRWVCLTGATGHSSTIANRFSLKLCTKDLRAAKLVKRNQCYGRLSLLPQWTPPGLCSLDAQSTATRMAFLVRRGFCCQGKEGGLTSHCYNNGPLGIAISSVFLWWWVCRCTCRLTKPYCPSCQPRGGNCARACEPSVPTSPPNP